MSALFNLLKPAPHIPEIQDPELIRSTYRYWRIRILYSMFIGYALYYFTRKSFTFAMPALMIDLGITDKSQLGILSSILAISYGFSKFFSGMICDFVNPRYMMAFGLIATGICNICFGLSSSLLLFSIFWGLNGWFQGFGWPPCARFLTQWYSHSERGSWWSIWNVSHNIGGFLIPFVVGVALHYAGWRYAMFLPGIICIFGGFFLLNRLGETPQAIGLPPIDQFRNDHVDKIESTPVNGDLSAKSILINYIVKNPYMWLLAVAYFFVYIVRMGVGEWSSLFLVETKGYTLLGANSCSALFEAGGFFGSLVAGWSSDYLFGAKRGPINVLFSVAALISFILFWYAPVGYSWLDSVSMFMIGFSIFGPQMMIGMAAVEISHKQSVGTATGFVGLFAYVGAACAGYPLGLIMDFLGWRGFYWALVACCTISIILLLPTWNLSANGIPKKPKQKYA